MGSQNQHVCSSHWISVLGFAGIFSVKKMLHVGVYFHHPAYEPFNSLYSTKVTISLFFYFWVFINSISLFIITYLYWFVHKQGFFFGLSFGMFIFAERVSVSIGRSSLLFESEKIHLGSVMNFLLVILFSMPFNSSSGCKFIRTSYT